MRKLYTTTLLTLLCLVVTHLSVFGQTTIAIQDFESSPATPTMTYTGGSIATGTGPFPSGDDNFVSGSRAIEENNGTSTVTFSTVDASAYTSVYFTCRVASFAGTSGNGADGADEIYIDISTNGGSTWSRELEIQGNSNAKWSFDTGTGTATITYDGNNSPTIFTPSGGGYRTTDGYSYVTINGLPSSSTLRVRLVMNNNSSNEYWIVDDATILGTAAASNDTDSEIYDTGSQPAAGYIYSTDDTPGEAVNVFDFTIEDLGSGDGLATQVTNINLKPHTTNTADWTDHIGGVIVRQGASTITTGAVAITDTEINIPITAGNLDIADGTSEDVEIYIYLNTTNIVDGDILSFYIDETAHDFTADVAGSTFTSSLLFGDFNSNDFTIDVDATELAILTQPSDVAVNTNMTPAVRVAYVDEHGNVDEDYDGLGFELDMTSSSIAFGSSPQPVDISVEPVDGVATFSTINYATGGTGETLTFTDNNSWLTAPDNTITSSTFNVTAPPINDLCSGAITLTVGASCSYTSYTNVNATNSGETPSPSCGSYSDQDVWFAIVVPANGEITVTAEDNGGFTDGAMEMYSGTCGFLTLIECDDDDGPGSMPQIHQTGLTPSSTVYIRFWEYNGGSTGTFDICVTSPTVLPEPTNHPTAFACGTTTSSSIPLSWTDAATGSQAPDGYLIKWSTGTITAPVDGTPEADGAGVQNVAHVGGSNSYTVTGLTSSTNYNFSIWSYTNTGAAIDYKLTGVGLQTTSCATISGPCLSDGFESGQPAGWANNSAYYNSGSAYSGSNKAGMNSTNDWIRTSAINNPNTVTFYARASGSTSNYTVELQYASSTSGPWTTAGTYQANGSNSGDVTTTYQQFSETIALSGTYYLRWEMTLRSGGSFYLDEVEVFCAAATAEIDVTGNSSNITDGQTLTSITDDTDFGSVPFASGSVAHTFTITNTGGLDLNLTGSPIVDLAYGTHFTVTTQPSGTVIAPSNSLTFVVTFDPTAAGTFTDTVIIENDDTNEDRFTFVIEGTGTNSANSDIIESPGFTYTSNILYLNNQATAPLTNASNNVGVFRFEIRDGGGSADADTEDTELTDITFTLTNASHGNYIRAAALFDGLSDVATSPAINAGTGTIQFSGLSGADFTALDNGSKTLTLRVSFTTTVVDNEQLEFEITSATANPTGSSFGAGGVGATSSTVGDRNRIEVVATELEFTQQPTDAAENTTMNPAVTVSGTDVNDLLDLDWSGNVSITSTGTMTGDPIGAIASSGVATFGSIVHTVAGTGFTLDASSTGFSTITSSTFDITTIVYVNGDYRTTGSGTWLSNSASPAIWERLVAGVWTVHNSPSYNTSNAVYIRDTHTITSGGSYGSSVDMKIMGGGRFNSNHPGTMGSIYIYDSGLLRINAAMSVNSSGYIEVEDDATVEINHEYGNPETSLWDGTEVFHPNSNLVFIDWDGDDVILEDNTSVSTNTFNGYTAVFGNIICDFGANLSASDDIQFLESGININLAHGDLIFRSHDNGVICGSVNNFRISTTGTVTSGIGGDFIVEDGFFFVGCFNTINFKTSGTLTFTIKGNMSLDQATTRLGAGTNPNSTLNIEGDLEILSGAFFDMQSTISASSSQTINLYGDLSAVASARLSATNSNASNNIFNFVGTGDGLTPETTQTIDIASTSSRENEHIHFIAKSGSYVQQINRDFELGEDGLLQVEGGATYDFGFSGTTPLILKLSGSQTGANFDADANCTLKITSPDGLYKNWDLYGGVTVNTGNVQGIVKSRRDIAPESTFWYVGKANQVTGDAPNVNLSAVADGKVVICDLENNSLTLEPTISWAVSNGTNVSATGGKLDIRSGQFIESTTAYITGSTGTLYMEPGTLYQIPKGNASIGASDADRIPRMAGATFQYVLNGGTIELAGSDVGNRFQTLRGSQSRPNYVNVKFSGTNTYLTDYKNLSSTTVIDSSLEITGTAVVDCINGSGTTESFNGEGGLIMSDNSRIRINNVSNVQPELNGNAVDYSLTGGTVELYGTSATQQQQLRGNFRTAPSTPVKINYYNIDINADAANLQTFATYPNSSQLGSVGNVDVNSSFLLTGTLNVNSPAVLRMDQGDFIDDGTGTSNVININAGGGLLYANEFGIKTSGTAVTDGNIRISGTRNFSTNANYGFVSSGNMVSGNGLPSNVAGLYIYKTNGLNEVTLNNGGVTVNGPLGLQMGKINSTVSNKLTLAAVGTSDIFSPANVGGIQNMGSDSSYVTGVIGHISNTTDEMIFPIGAAIYGPMALTPQSSTSQTYNVDYVSAGFGNQTLDPSNSPQLDHVSYVEYWNVNSTESGTNDDAIVKLFWRQYSDVGSPSDWSNLRVVHFDGVDWNTEGNSPTIIGSSNNWGSIESNIYVPNFSPITIGTITRNNPLPVELVSFTTTERCPDVLLEWVTASETNNDYFELQYSLDGITFETVVTISGNGTTNQVSTYQFLHENILSTIHYYRLKQVDFDGTTTYSKVIDASCGNVGNSMEVINTLTDNELILQFQSATENNGQLVIYAANGQVVERQSLSVQQGASQVRIDVQNLASAMYIIQWYNGEDLIERKFFKR